MSRWKLQEDGDPENGYTWRLLIDEGQFMRCVAEYRDERWALEGLAAHEWYSNLKDGSMSLPAKKGAPRKVPDFDIVFEPAPARRKRKPT